MILFYFCVMRLLSFLSCLYLSFFFINCIIKYCCLFCWRPAVMALALPVAFRTLLTCLFIFVFGFCAENKFFFFFFSPAVHCFTAFCPIDERMTLPAVIGGATTGTGEIYPTFERWRGQGGQWNLELDLGEKHKSIILCSSHTVQTVFISVMTFSYFTYLLVHFYPRDTLHSAVFVAVRCPSVRPSVCHTPVLCLNG